MPESKATELSGCNEEVPLLGVTREFDFGQFIELFDSTEDPLAPDLPTLSRVVIQPNSTLASDRDAAVGAPPSQAVSKAQASTGTIPKSKAINSNGAPRAPALVASSDAGAPEVDLFSLVDRGPSAKRAPTPLEIEDVDTFVKTGTFEYGGKTFKATLPKGMREGMSQGLAFTVNAVPDHGQGAVPFRVYPSFHPIKLTKESMAHVLAGNTLDNSGGVKPVLTVGAIRALLAGTPVLTHGKVGSTGKQAPLALFPPEADLEPRARSFQLFDVPSFLANPALPAKDGTLIPLDLSTKDVEKLLKGDPIQPQVAGKPYDVNVVDRETKEYLEYIPVSGILFELGMLALKPVGEPWVITLTIPPKLAKNPHFVHPLFPDQGDGPVRVAGSGNGSSNSGSGQTQPAQPGQTSSLTDRVQPRLPTGSGIPVAVFVPWKQTWTLKGFSRGNLLSTIALAPSEQVTMQVSSWERRSRTLEQSSETEVDQQTDVNQSTRDTEDVFKEMLAKRDFAWQLSGSIDASYSPGVASIKVHAGGGVSETNSIQQTARSSSQNVRESTIKASSRVRSKRVTKVTQTVESGRDERVTRVIRNPNQCHTLTLDFFETLAHYEIKLQFLKERLRLVVLVPNPIKVPDFDSAVVRRNESALRNALIDQALDEGFAACRLAAAYDEAKVLINLQKSEAAKVEEIETQRTLPAPANTSPAASPQEAEVVRVVGEMINALRSVRQGAGIDQAMTEIRFNRPVSESMRRRGQQWLFINFCAAKFPALLAVLDEISQGGATGVTAAQKILSVLPRPDAPTNLGNLNQMSDGEKESACLASKLKELDGSQRRKYMQMDWDWGWWTMRLKEEGLYTANDGGLGGGADQLQKAYTAWEAKKAQGDAMKDQDVAKTEAEGRQEKASTDDKLSMAFPLEDLARAYERMKVLFAHLNEHREFYNYALFQALPPSEQVLRIVEAGNGKLQVGLFEPRVVAMSGSRLVVPLTPLAGSEELQSFIANLGEDLDEAFSAALETPDTTVLPTPGVSVSSRLGKCTGCEEFIESSRKLELDRLKALVDQERAEADRRTALIADKDYGEFRALPASVKLALESKGPA